MRLVTDIGKLLDILVENHSDDVSSMKKALKILSLSSIYYGISRQDADAWRRAFNSNKRLFKNKICDERQDLRFLTIETMALQIENNGQSSITIIDDGCHPGDRDDNAWLTIDGYIPPKTQIEWEQTCFLDKLFHGYNTWPKIVKYSINKRERYSRNNMPEQAAILYSRFMDSNFVKRLTQLMILDDEDDNDETTLDKTRFAMFKGLFRNFGLAFIDNFMEQVYVLIHEKMKEKQKGSHRVAAEIVAGMIRGSKCWTLEMLDELWEHLTTFLNEVCINLSSNTFLYWGSCFKYAMENKDPRRMYRPIQFLRALINNQTSVNTLNEVSRWYLIQQLDIFEWRIPSIWYSINEHVKKQLDHPFKVVRDRMVIILSLSLRFDLTLFHGKPTRQPSIDQSIDEIRERLHQTIETYEKTSLVNMSDQLIEINSEVRQMLNFIETGRDVEFVANQYD
ncbi:unnamed protein product [Rotaria sordida]|uniref:Proteasome activator complex subunit 4-like HEAT repeat-like domain-containing protein n=1 Tax=Rotaria sordida TaxID=392033 RepID=A0A814V980_9BILA|nr:unnamed protein product [Rotaria sordida]